MPSKLIFACPTALANYHGIARVASLALLLLIGWLDYITGYELEFFVFYFIPIAISAWYCGTKDGICMAITSAACWYFSDRFTYHPYSHAYFIYWEMFMRLVTFLIAAITISKNKNLVLNNKRMNDALHEVQSQLERKIVESEVKCSKPSTSDGSIQGPRN
jgi:hypothetical protein